MLVYQRVSPTFSCLCIELSRIWYPIQEISHKSSPILHIHIYISQYETVFHPVKHHGKPTITCHLSPISQSLPADRRFSGSKAAFLVGFKITPG